MRAQTPYSRSMSPARRALIVLAGCGVCAPALAGETGFVATVTLASEYIYLGKALSDGNPAVQVGIDYQHRAGWFAGAWASTIDIRSSFGRRDTEVDYYAGYHHEFKAPLTLAVAFVRYTYPGQTGSFDYEYDRWLATLTVREHYSLEVGYSDDMYGFGRRGRHWELRADRPLDSAWVVSAGLGRNELASIGASDYLYGDLGVSARFARATVDLRWHDNEPVRGILARMSAGSRVVASVTWAF